LEGEEEAVDISILVLGASELCESTGAGGEEVVGAGELLACGEGFRSVGESDCVLVVLFALYSRLCCCLGAPEGEGAAGDSGAGEVEAAAVTGGVTGEATGAAAGGTGEADPEARLASEASEGEREDLSIFQLLLKSARAGFGWRTVTPGDAVEEEPLSTDADAAADGVIVETGVERGGEIEAGTEPWVPLCGLDDADDSL
jgi:hypothetical protein